jgi:hypothetical protein
MFNFKSALAKSLLFILKRPGEVFFCYFKSALAKSFSLKSAFKISAAVLFG